MLAACSRPSSDKGQFIPRAEIFRSPGEWLANSIYEIQWTASTTETEPLTIGLYQDGQFIQSIIETEDSEGQIFWAAPANLPAGNNYRIGIAKETGLISQKSEALTFLPQKVWQMHVISSIGIGPDGVRLVDTNGDGLLDVTTSFESSGDVTLFQHPGFADAASPWPSVQVGNVARGEDALGADLDGDGAIDVISSHEGDTLGIYVHWAPSVPQDYLVASKWQTELLPASQGRGWMFAILMDVNRDGLLDIVAGSKDDYFNNRNAVGDLGWFEAPAKGKRDLDRWRYHTIGHVGWTMSLIDYDVDEDGDLDLLVTDRNADKDHQGPRWLENPGPPWAGEWTSHFMGDLAGTNPMFMSTGDLDQDGIDEFVIPFIDKFRVLILKHTLVDSEVRFFPNEIRFGTASALGTLKAAQAGDINQDGRLDVVLTFVGGQIGVLWLSYSESPFAGIWEVHIVSDISGGKYDLVQLYDVDGDGDLDIMTTEEQLNLGILWFENPTINREIN